MSKNTVMTWGNPFTHEEHTRECIPNTDGRLECDYCENHPKRLFIYDGSYAWGKHRAARFCNKKCFKSYYW